MTTGRTDWPWLADRPLLLASGSATRAAMLRAAGLPVETESADIDERALDEPLRAAGASAIDRALALARAKALDVARKYPGRLVLGADQTLAAPNHSGAKARDRAEARAQLQRLSGRAHRLHSAAALARDGAVLFACVETATLHMRALSSDFVDRYLDREGDAALTSVGGYRIEETGALLFDRIDGDHAVILGLPLLPLLAFLRRHGALAA